MSNTKEVMSASVWCAQCGPLCAPWNDPGTCQWIADRHRSFGHQACVKFDVVGVSA